jgi:hypothetical protein
MVCVAAELNSDLDAGAEVVPDVVRNVSVTVADDKMYEIVGGAVAVAEVWDMTDAADGVG